MAISRREALTLTALAVASNAFATRDTKVSQPKPKTNYKAPIPDTKKLELL